MSYKFNAWKVHILLKVCKDYSNLTLSKMLGLTISLIWEIIQNSNIFGQTIV